MQGSVAHPQATSCETTAAVSNAQEALDRSEEKLTGLEDEVAKLDLRYRELSVDPLTPSSSKVASETGDGPHLAEVQSCTDGMGLTGQCGDADPSEPPAGSPSPGPDRNPPSAPIAPFVQNEDTSKLCRVAAAFSHDFVALGCVICMGWTSQPTACQTWCTSGKHAVQHQVVVCSWLWRDLFWVNALGNVALCSGWFRPAAS